MASKAPIPTAPSTAVPVILFGTDASGKPKAARFLDKHADLAAKAAAQLNLRLLKVEGRSIEDLAARLPQGRIHANGRGFLPYIRRDLYEQLSAAAAGPSVPAAPVAPAVLTATSAGHRLDFPTSGQQPGRPSDWDHISIGHSVIAMEEPGWGWYEAVVAEIHGEMLTLRWRYYPRLRRIVRHRLSVALLYTEAPSATPAKPANGSKLKDKSPATVAANADVAGSALPKTWDDIGIDSLVLAEEDGPWRTWWEAVPVSNQDQTLTLQWRNFRMLPNIQRPRLAVALLYPNGH